MSQQPKDNARECFSHLDNSTYYSIDKKTITNQGCRTHTSYGSFTIDSTAQSICIWDIQINDIGEWVSIGIKDIVSYKNNGNINHFKSGYIYKSGDIITMELNTATGSITFYKTFLSKKHYIHRIETKKQQQPTIYQLSVTLSDTCNASSVTIKDFNIIGSQNHQLKQSKNQMIDYFEYIGDNIKLKNNKTTISNQKTLDGTCYGHFVINTSKTNNIYRWIINTKNIKRNSKQCELAIGIADADSLSNLNSNICSNVLVTRYVYTQNTTLYTTGNKLSSWLSIGGDDVIILELNAQRNSLICYNHKLSKRSRECKGIKPGKYRLAVYLKASKHKPSITIQEFEIVGDYKDECTEKKNDDRNTTNVMVKEEQKQRSVHAATNTKYSKTMKKKAENDDLVSPLLNRIDNQNKEMEQLKQEIISLKDKETKHDKKRINFQTTVAALKEENNKLKNEYEIIEISNEAQRQILSEMTVKHQALEANYSNLKDSLKEQEHFKTENHRLNNENQLQNNKVVMMEQQLEQLKLEINILKQENNVLKDEQKEYEMNINNLKNEIKTLKIKAININSFMEWDSEDVLNWLFSIENGLFTKYEDKLRKQIKENEMCGKDLITMNIEDITYLGVTKFSDKKLLMKHIQKLIEINQNKQNKSNEQIGYNQNEGIAAQTPYI